MSKVPWPWAGPQDACHPWVTVCSGGGFASLMAGAPEAAGGLSAASSLCPLFLVTVPGGHVPVLAGGTWELFSAGFRWGEVGQSSLMIALASVAAVGPHLENHFVQTHCFHSTLSSYLLKFGGAPR